MGIKPSLNIRDAVVAGTFYPADPQNLSYSINKYLSDADAILDSLKPPQIPPKTPPKAFIVPHAGYIYSGPIAGVAYRLMQKFYGANSAATKAPLKILLLGLSHQILLNGAAVSTYSTWQTPLGKVSVKNLRDEIPNKIPGAANILKEFEEAHEAEHSLEVQVPFLQTILKNFTLYPLAISEVDPERLAKTLFPFASQKDVIIIVSSDLSHYLPYKKAQEADQYSCKLILNLETEKAAAINACNKTGILTLMHIAKKLKLTPQLLDYRNSGDTAGDKLGVVGYASLIFGDGSLFTKQ